MHVVYAFPHATDDHVVVYNHWTGVVNWTGGLDY